MEVLLFLVPLAVGIAFIGVLAFFWTVGSGQYDDLERAANSILLEEAEDDRRHSNKKSESERQ